MEARELGIYLNLHSPKATKQEYQTAKNQQQKNHRIGKGRKLITCNLGE